MSRYIDADAFLKEYCEPYPHVFMAMSKAFADAPSIDIVTCKECKHWKWIEWAKEYRCILRNTASNARADDFCSYGERREP